MLSSALWAEAQSAVKVAQVLFAFCSLYLSDEIELKEHERNRCLNIIRAFVKENRKSEWWTRGF